MQAILYTDTDRVRSALGVDDRDLPDPQITDRDLAKELRFDLLSWLPTHVTLFNAGEQPTATETEQSIADAITLYCTYFCSVLLAKSFQISSPQKVSDGKNEMNRFSTIDWQGLNNFLRERMMFYKNNLIDLTAAQSSSTAVKLFTGVGLAVDPVKTAET